ncbi:MAG TPA: hypothetical protein VGK38_15195 [Prolixibacteraceae bacterium]
MRNYLIKIKRYFTGSTPLQKVLNPLHTQEIPERSIISFSAGPVIQAPVFHPGHIANGKKNTGRFYQYLYVTAEGLNGREFCYYPSCKKLLTNCQTLNQPPS